MSRNKKLAEIRERVRENSALNCDPIPIPPYTFVEIVYSNEGDLLIGRGFAKCRPGLDVFDKARGIDIAQGRAELDIVRQLCTKRGDDSASS